MVEVIIDGEIYTCNSYTRTTNSLNMFGVVVGDTTKNIELVDVNWDKIILPEPTEPEPSLEEQIAALKEENRLVQQAMKEMILW